MFDTYECAWCAEDYYGSPGGVCDDCQRDAEQGIAHDERIYGEECGECGMDMGEHLRSCPFHRSKVA